MPNTHRGEVALTLGSARYTLCLTLGALAERFASGRLSSRDLVVLLACALRGGGHALTDAEVAALPLAEGLEPVTRALADCLVATFGTAPNP